MAASNAWLPVTVKFGYHLSTKAGKFLPQRGISLRQQHTHSVTTAIRTRASGAFSIRSALRACRRQDDLIQNKGLGFLARRGRSGHMIATGRLRAFSSAKNSTRSAGTKGANGSSSASTRRAKATLTAPPPSRQQQQQQQLHQQWEQVSLKQLAGQFLRKPHTIPIPRWITPRHYTFCYSECFGHASFILVAISYAVDDFLMLRMIAVVASTSMLFFTYFHPHGRVLWLPFKWNALFIAINSYRIGKAYADRYLAEKLPRELIQIRDNNFYIMHHVDFYKLVRLGTVKEYSRGEVILMQGDMNPCVRLVVDGELKVLFNGKITYCLEKANFVAESGLHVGLLLPGCVESCCSLVVNSEKTRILVWDRNDLIDLMRRDHGLKRSLQAALSWDLIRKLKAQRLQWASGFIIDDPDQWTERRNQQTVYRYENILRNLLSHPQYLQECRKELKKYRLIHHIDDQRHEAALEQLGWTVEEFEDGHKQGEEGDHDHYDVKRNWWWYLQDLYLRVFG